MVSGKRLTHKEFVEKANLVHNNKYDYSQDNYVNNKTKVKIICPVHGVFKQTPQGHLSGRGCSKCAGRKNTKEFIEEAKVKHGNKYNYKEVEYINSYTKITIICPVHGRFEQRPAGHLTGAGCPKCADNALTTEEFIRRSKEVHGDCYDYSQVYYIKSSIKVKILCLKHGAFEQLPFSHLYGQGCPKCFGFKDTEDFIKMANKIHNKKYNYSQTKYTNYYGKIKIICPIHGVFKQRAGDHLNGHGCSACADTTLTIAEFIKKSNNIHNKRYDYSQSNYTNSYTKIKIICQKHGVFEQRPSDHLSGAGCPKCVNSISKVSNDWLDANAVKDREKIIYINGQKIVVDGIDYKTNTIYEFFGDFWHGNPKRFDLNDINPCNKKTYGELYNLTLQKIELIKNSKYNLKYIWESEWLKKQKRKH